MKNSKIGFLLLNVVLSQTSCSLLIGNIKPAEEKSSTYSILDLTTLSSDWIRSDYKEDGQETGAAPDRVYQSKKTSSVISVNSVCKSYRSDKKQDLGGLTHQLILGISQITFKEEMDTIVDRVPALQTTIQGILNDETVLFRTVVFQKNNCVYDLVYVSSPNHFKMDEGDFSKFVSSFRLR